MTRKITQTKKTLEASDLGNKERRKVEKTLFELRVDLNYILVRIYVLFCALTPTHYRTSRSTIPKRRNTYLCSLRPHAERKHPRRAMLSRRSRPKQTH